jgi:hypothetical protein
VWLKQNTYFARVKFKSQSHPKKKKGMTDVARNTKQQIITYLHGFEIMLSGK